MVYIIRHVHLNNWKYLKLIGTGGVVPYVYRVAVV